MIRTRLASGFIAAGIAAWLLSPAPCHGRDHAESSLRAADQAERDAFFTGDPVLQERIWGPTFVVTTPGGEVLGRDVIIGALESGARPYRRFERETERVQVHDGFAVTLGRETVVPMTSDTSVYRRYTHLWMRHDDGWRLVARHASLLDDVDEGTSQ